MAALATTEKVLLVILFVSDLVAAQNRLSPCYDSQKRPLRCEPIFSNPAFGLPIEATNTCGELVRTDPYGQFYGPLKLESFRRFYRQTGATGATKDSDYCDANAADPSKRHPPKNMVDLDAGHNKTWWQSITLYEYKEREIGDMVQASITLHLGKAFDITYIRLIFHSPRPESFSIWKKTTDTSDWEPYQYYSASCLSTFNVPQDGIIDTPTRAICTREYTHISPLSGGNVAFSTLDNRPNAYEFDRNKLLQEFVTATAIQIRLRRLNTFGDEVFEDTSVLQSYYYAVSEISVGGKCKCNGHANECVQTNSLDGNSRLVCQCQHNTTGPDCNQCLRTHNDKPWAPATILDANVCQECQCNGRSSICNFNQTLYDRTGSGGYCQDCRDFTDGPHCEKCRPNYFRRNPADVCSECQCNEIGSVNLQCDNSGQCRCKPGVTGPKCDRCEANYYDFGTYGCRPCGCVEAGSFDNTPYCDSVTGQCNCKMNVEGQDCGTCKPGFFNLDLANKYGCIACFCNGKTSQCTSATGYIRAFVDSYFDDNAERWTAVNERLGDNVPVIYNPLTEDLEVSSNASTGLEIYFSAPEGYLGDQKYSYNQFLEFSLRMGDSSSANPTAKDVILEGNGRQVYLPIFAQNNPIPQTELQIYKFRLNEHPFYQWTPTLSALEFQRLLSSLTAIKIRGTYNLQSSGFLDDVKFHTAHNGQQIGDITSIERCVCPKQYIGQNCESCAPGYRRETPFGGRASECVPCECNGHSDTCDPNSGACICQHDTMGHNCEKCKEGWYGNAEDGTPNDCTPCPCPGQGACYEQLDGSVSCLNCPTGYSGDLCDMCEDGFYDLDNLSTSDVNCTQCDCSGNIDSNAVGNCNATGGVCLKCIDNTGGDHCEVCLSGFYGNATAEEKGDCKPCECNSFGTESDKLDVCELETGQCSCLPYVTGRQCDQCEDGYFNLESSTGCEACLCNLIGSLNTTCDLQTGQCDCKTGISGLRCDVCVQDHFGFSNVGCQSCDCLDIGSAHGQCDESGQCVCKDDTRITGLHCDECRENKYNLTAGCPDCPACYNLVQDAVNDIRQSLTNLSDTLKSINDNPDAVDDAEFTAQLKEIEDRVNALYNRSLDLQNSGGPVSDDLQEIDSQILDLKNKALEIQVIVASTQEEYDRIDLDTLDGHISNASAEVADSRNKFAAESSQLYNDILAALGKNGPKSESQNMTALAQQSIEIVAKQKVDAEKIVEVADNSNEISSRAYQLAVKATKSPEDLEMKLSLLQDRFNGARNILELVDEAAKKALDKATMIHTNAIESLYDAERTIVPDIDTSLQLAEARNILEQAVLQKNQTAVLMEKFESLINETQTQIENAEELFNRTYVAQQNTDDLMAEVDVALQRALQAIQDPEDLLAEALEQLKTLQEFDQVVKESKEKAVEALKMIPTIEELLDRADNETSRARETVEGAKQAANEAKQTALDAQLTANEASENAAKILAEAKDAKLDVDAEANKTDIHEIQLNALSEQINQTRPLEEADKLLIDVVLTEAERARQRARDAAAQLMNAKNQVDSIINSLATLPELNTTELDRLEEEMDKIEAEINLENINMQVKELTQFNDMQLHLVNQHWDSLDQLKADVLNLEMIVAAVPKPPLCYKVPVLEKAADGGKRRRRLRKLRKRHRH